MTRLTLLAIPLVGLSACGGGATTPAFQADGLQAVLGQQVYQGSDTLAAGGTGYSYQVGLNSSESALLAEADLTTPSTLPDPPETGFATMTGPLELRAYLNPTTATGSLSATGIARNSTLVAEVDFLNGKLTADNGSGAALFTVDGTFSRDGSLRGTTAYQGIEGTLGGDVSGSNAIGVFEGGGAFGVYAGGFVVED